MTDTTAPAESPRLDPVAGEWRRVSPKYLTIDLISNLIWTVIMVGVAVVAVVIFEWPPLGWLLPAGLAVIFLTYAALTPRRVRAIGYMLRDDDLLFRTGIMFRRIVAVPYGRMQLVDINRGPLARAVGLAELKLVTAAAATAVTIPGLPFDEAEQLRDHLVAVAETRRAGL
ncbi:PH domain-containing protein [Salinibacterium sp. ZJ70]|uniref:PH domain-containing protein n=1 Tax=Salinibacterium sp. ZJ70 TaxID=2708084 RepID=UPI001CD5973F|nr:PH domain-containing protein [Salinibacterium sp. ZJ70]